MKRILALFGLLAASSALAASPQNAKVGITHTTDPEVVSVLDALNRWAEMGTIDKTTGIFTVQGGGGGGGGGPTNITQWAGQNVGAPTAPGIAGTGLFPNINAIITSPAHVIIDSGGGTLTWPGTASPTAYGVAPSGTVPAVNAAITTPLTFTWPGTAPLTNYGTAPTGSVPAVNSFCTNCSAATLTWPGTAVPTNYGTTPSGTVPAVNAAVQFPTTQAVSIASQPLPTGAATSALQSNVQSALGTPATVAVTIQGSPLGTPQPTILTGTLPSFGSTPTFNCGSGCAAGVGWSPDGSYATLTIPNNNSVSVALPSSAVVGSVVKIYNRGPNAAFWTVGGSGATATNLMAQLPPQSWDAFVVKAGQTTLAAIVNLSTQSATLNLESGTGSPNGTGGPINNAVNALGQISTFAELVGGLDNGSVLRQLQVTAPGTAAASFLLGVQGSPTGTPLPVTIISGGTGGGAMTVADGADVAEGAKADAAWTSGSGSVVALLKAVVGGINAGYEATIGATKTIQATNVPPGSCSATITTGGTAQNLPNLGTANIHGFTILNKDNATGSGEGLGVNFVSTAALTGSIDTAILPPPTDAKGTGGGSYTTSIGFNHAVSVIAATTGHVVYCVWW